MLRDGSTLSLLSLRGKRPSHWPNTKTHASSNPLLVPPQCLFVSFSFRFLELQYIVLINLLGFLKIKSGAKRVCVLLLLEYKESLKRFIFCIVLDDCHTNKEGKEKVSNSLPFSYDYLLVCFVVNAFQKVVVLR